jgi:hypothetical protein
VVPVRGSALARRKVDHRHRSARGPRATATAAAAVLPLTYHGGAVMHSNQVYAIYWYPTGYAPPAGYTTGIDRFFSDVAADNGKLTNVYATDPQYTDLTGKANYQSTFKASLLDTQPFPASDCTNPKTSVCLSGDVLSAEIDRVIAAQHWPRGLTSMYFIFTPSGVGSCDPDTTNPTGTSCSFVDYCAYHTWSGSGASTTLWANMPYAASDRQCSERQSPNHNQGLDSELSVVSHEHNETVTDPNGGGWYVTDLLPDGSSAPDDGKENGDRCYTDFGTALGATGGTGTQYNQQINGHPYWLQTEWSNKSLSCVQAMAPAPTAALAAPKTATVGVPVTLTATPSPLTGNTVSPTMGYHWDFGDGTSTDGGSVQEHSFSSPGPFTVTVTVTETPDAQTAQAVALIAVSSPPPPAAAPPASSSSAQIATPPIPSDTSADPAVAPVPVRPSPPVQPRPAASAPVSILRQPLATLARQGLLLVVAAGAARRGEARLTVDRATARRLHLGRSNAAGRASFTTATGAQRYVRLHLNAKVRSALAHHRHLTVNLRLVLTGPRGGRSIITRTIRL